VSASKGAVKEVRQAACRSPHAEAHADIVATSRAFTKLRFFETASSDCETNRRISPPAQSRRFLQELLTGSTVDPRTIVEGEVDFINLFLMMPGPSPRLKERQ